MKLNKRLALGGAAILAFAQTASAHTGDAPHNHPHASHNSISEYLMANPVVGNDRRGRIGSGFVHRPSSSNR